ncbi:hypothetical protein FT637_06500 [Bacillus cereus]|nr:hypothetical protein [Bacillus cereus]
MLTELRFVILLFIYRFSPYVPPLFIPLFAGSKTPTSKFGYKAKKLGGSRAVCKCPIGES